MKFHSLLLSIGLLLSSVLLIGCGEDVVKKTKSSIKPPSYPVKRNLKNKDGRSFQALIISKTPEQITCKRIKDGRVFVVPIKSLSKIDQDFIAKLPTQSGLVEREEEISNVIKEIEQLKRELDTAQPSLMRAIISELEVKNTELIRLRARLAEFKELNGL